MPAAHEGIAEGMTLQARRALVVLAMTTAFCADQIAVAAPASHVRPVEIAEVAHRIVTRLSETLRTTQPAHACQLLPSARPAARVMPLAIWTTPLSVGHAPSTPFQFRLPPPNVL